MTRLDRRALFTSGAAAALLAASGLSLASRPQRGGRLRIALAREEGSLDRVARGAIFDTLTEVAPDGVLRGELASGWQGSPDARTWDFTLREGVRFHDGATLTVADAADSLLAHPATAALIRRAEATGAGTLRLTLAEGNPHLPYLLSDSALIVCRDGAVEGAMEHCNGTGLYAVRRMQDDRHFLGQRVAAHYRDGQAGWADAVDAIVIPDPAVRAEALRDGYVDVAELPTPQGLSGRGEFVYHPSAEDVAIAARAGVGVPRVVGTRSTLDDGRIAERWWLA